MDWIGREAAATLICSCTRQVREVSVTDHLDWSSKFLGANMSIYRRCVSTTIAAAMLVAASAPAMARDRGGYGHGRSYGHGHHRDRISGGGVLAAIAVFGFLAAIAASSSKNRDRSGRSVSESDDRRLSSEIGAIVTENDAVDACASAAETRVGKASSVRDITDVSVAANGWDVAGVIESRAGWRKSSGATRSFRCTVRGGAIADLFIDANGFALQ